MTVRFPIFRKMIFVSLCRLVEQIQRINTYTWHGSTKQKVARLYLVSCSSSNNLMRQRSFMLGVCNLKKKGRRWRLWIINEWWGREMRTTDSVVWLGFMRVIVEPAHCFNICVMCEACEGYNRGKKADTAQLQLISMFYMHNCLKINRNSEF